MDWRMHRPELARDPLMKEFVDGRRGQAIASSSAASRSSAEATLSNTPGAPARDKHAAPGSRLLAGRDRPLQQLDAVLGDHVLEHPTFTPIAMSAFSAMALAAVSTLAMSILVSSARRPGMTEPHIRPNSPAPPRVQPCASRGFGWAIGLCYRQ
jgi:hypothetical protein